MAEPTVAALCAGDYARLVEDYSNGREVLLKDTILHLHAILPDRIMACVEHAPEVPTHQPPGLPEQAVVAITQGVVYLSAASAKLRRVRRVERWEDCP